MVPAYAMVYLPYKSTTEMGQILVAVLRFAWLTTRVVCGAGAANASWKFLSSLEEPGRVTGETSIVALAISIKSVVRPITPAVPS